MSRWANVPLGSLLTPWQQPHPVKPHVSYPIAGVFGFGRGMISRPAVLGSEISATQLFQIKSGQLIYSKLKAFEGAFAITTASDHGRFVSSEFPTFDIDTTRADSAYIAWYFRRPSFWQDIRGQSTGTVNRRERLHPDQLLRHEVPLPPLDEQRRIVDLLERAAGIRRLREQALAKARAIVPALFLDMFGDPASNPKGWPVVTLGNAIKLSSGSFLPARNMDMAGAYPVYGGNGVNGRHSSFTHANDSIVIGRVGAYCGNVHLAYGKSWITDNALAANFDQSMFCIEFLKETLLLARLNRFASQMGQPLISGKRISAVPLLRPPLMAQQAFADRLADLRSIIAQQERSLAAARELERSLMARLLG